jgi:hypothetical protein
MKLFFKMTLLMACVGLLSAKPKPSERADGWVSLFDGKTKKGWHVYNHKSQGNSWKAANGVLYFEPTTKGGEPGGGDLITDDEFDNFDLKLQWKIDTGGNSGVLFYVHEDPKIKDTYNSGPEMQVLDNARHEDAKIKTHRAGDLYDLISCSKETAKPALQWNQVEVVSNKGSLDLFVNGTKVIHTTMWDDNWKKMIAKSKFKEWPVFGTFQKGHFALQDHGYRVWFKDIMIKKL